MSFRDCLTRAALRGAITEGKRDEALKLLEDYERELKDSGISDDAAAEQAAQKATEEIRRMNIRKKQLLVLAHSAKQKVDVNLDVYKDGNGHIDYAKAAKAMIENDGFAPFASFTGKKRVYLGRFHGMLSDFIEKFGKGIYSPIRHIDGLDDIGRELFGENTGNATARTLAKSISDTFEAARVTANSLGADISKKDRYGLPQHHNTLHVAKAGKKAWVESVLPKLDFTLMRDATGKSMSSFGDAEKLDFLGRVWETLKTDGNIKINPGDKTQSRALADRLGSRRYLEFKSYDDWKSYNDEFGDGDVFTNVINHVEHMSKEIAMMDVFGPNPTAMKHYISESALKHAAEKDVSETGAVNKIHSFVTQKKLREFDEMWGMATGKNSVLSNDYFGFTMAGIRNLITASKLAASPLSAVPGDMVTVRMAKAISGLPGSRFITHYVSNLAKSDDRQLAIRLGLIAEAATSIAGQHHRYMGDLFGPAWTKNVSDFILRVNGLTGHTQAARWAHGMEWLGYFADNKGEAFKDLDVKAALERAGITEGDWNEFRKTPLYEHEGAKFLRPDDVLTRDDLHSNRARDLADKFQMFVIDEMHRAVPEATLHARAALLGESKPGTLTGELLRSFAMYKNFPITLLMQMQRGIMLQQGLRSRAAFAATYGLMLTAVGALTVQLQQLSKGRDPISMNPSDKFGRAFWGQAALTGGGLGIWGDFLFRDANRFGGGLMSTVAGPVAQFGSDVQKLTVGNVLKTANGQKTSVGPDLLNFVHNNMPGSNLWYARLILQNGIMDAIQRAVDPDAMAKWQRDQANYYRDYGQQYWWKRGNVAPSRAPDLSAAGGR